MQKHVAEATLPVPPPPPILALLDLIGVMMRGFPSSSSAPVVCAHVVAFWFCFSDSETVIYIYIPSPAASSLASCCSTPLLLLLLHLLLLPFLYFCSVFFFFTHTPSSSQSFAAAASHCGSPCYGSLCSLSSYPVIASIFLHLSPNPI